MSSPQDIAALLPAAWPEYAGYASGPLPVTSDLVASAAFTVDAAEDLSVPSNCDTYCEPSINFYSSAQIAGVEWTWDTLSIDAGTRFRLRPYILDTGIGYPVPRLRLLPPCDAPCQADELRCANDAVCYGPDEYCRICNGARADRCACFTFCGPLPEGSYCEYFSGGDILTIGTCSSGACVGTF